MKNALSSNWSRCALAAVAGLLLAASFPKLGVAGFAWVAPALMLAAARGKTGRDAFRIGYVAGLAHCLASLYWLLLIPVAWFPILGWISLSAYLALYPAAWLWLLAGKIGEGAWLRRTAWSITGAAIWVALDMIVARLFGGFPWNFVGASQYRMVPLIQITSVTGVYGVSFLVVWTSLSLFGAALMILRQPASKHAWQREVILPLAALAAVFAFGFDRLKQDDPSRPTLRVTFIQPSIPQTMIWNPSENTNRFRQLIQMTAQALTNETDLLLWPEAAVPKMIRYDESTLLAVTGLARSNHVWMIIGSDDAEPPRGGSKNSDDEDDFNASFLISPDGKIAKRYCKRHLVIFGEYVPLVRWLPFVKWLTPVTGGFTPGDRPARFELDDLKVKTSVLICFEDIFPRLARESVEDDTDFLVNLTNDGWFSESAEQWQHAANAVFRAVENGVPLLRCCNNGVTCWVDSRGRLQQIFRDPTGTVYGAGVMSARIPVLAPGQQRPPTFYHRHGDWFGWGCVGITAVVLLRRLIRC